MLLLAGSLTHRLTISMRLPPVTMPIRRTQQPRQPPPASPTSPHRPPQSAPASRGLSDSIARALVARRAGAGPRSTALVTHSTPTYRADRRRTVSSPALLCGPSMRRRSVACSSMWRMWRSAGATNCVHCSCMRASRPRQAHAPICRALSYVGDDAELAQHQRSDLLPADDGRLDARAERRPRPDVMRHWMCCTLCAQAGANLYGGCSDARDDD